MSRVRSRSDRPGLEFDRDSRMRRYPFVEFEQRRNVGYGKGEMMETDIAVAIER